MSSGDKHLEVLIAKDINIWCIAKLSQISNKDLLTRKTEDTITKQQ